ncbi:cytochrome P450, partial [Streptomyces albiflaviniger]|nr:cytochrome P450 [Streptomyces albiflaviniger]
TWGGTLAAVQAFAATELPEPASQRALAKVQREVVCKVATQLGNTPAVCRKAYIDPCVFAGWERGELAELAGEFHQWLTTTVRTGEATADSFIGALARHRLPDGAPLDPQTAVAACFFVFIAGQSTTGQLIATVLRRALSEPGLWPRVAQEEEAAGAWVEEVLRREPPVTTWRRVVARPVELGGVKLPAGAQLLLMLMGSGSDPEVFTDPERMCPHRANIRHHLAFGTGRHRCPGASLARTEAAVALRAAARGLPKARLVEGAEGTPMLGLLSFRAPLRVAVAESPFNG